MQSWSGMKTPDIGLQVLEREIRAIGRPVHINILARAAVRDRLERGVGERHYAPAGQYAEGEAIRLEGQLARIKSVRAGSNPKQRSFSILTLELPDGTVRYMAAEVPDAPAEDRKPVTDEQVSQVIGEYGPTVRRAVQKAMSEDDRFVCFQNAQGDHWCLVEMLPEVGGENLARIWPLLRGRLINGSLHPRPTEELVKALWGQENDGSEAYALREFALNVSLERSQKARWLGDGWVLEEDWRKIQERPRLVGPREENVVKLPPGVTPPGPEIVDEGEQEIAQEEKTGAAEDLESWRGNRPRNASITLKAKHYYEGWLPLTRDMRRLFPPLSSGSYSVTFHHRFGGDEESFRAWVDWHQGRILGSPQMYEAFYEHGIYPGAKLVISHRSNLWDYDIRTKPIKSDKKVCVRRVSLSESGDFEYEEMSEPLRYQVDGDVFIADARWEDLPALFKQAQEVGKGIFQLMYEKCCEWWEVGERQPLDVTAQQLFEAIHFDPQGRLTSKATIAWELWQRLAFEPVGGGKYRFRPEYGDRVRSLGQKRPPPGPDTVQGEPIWQEVARLVGKELKTLEHGNPFRILRVTDRSLHLLVGSTDRERMIQYKEIVCAWQHLSEQRELSRSEIHAHYSEFNPAYVAAILAALPDVEYETRPIRLFYRPDGEEKVVPSPKPTIERTRGGQLVAADLVPPGPIFEEQPATSAGLPSEQAAEMEPTGTSTGPEALASPPAGAGAGGPETPARPPEPTRPRPERPRPPSKSLFSQHYLTHRIQEHPEWGEDVSEPFEALRALYARQRDKLPGLNEAQTEREFIQPALEILGFAYILQTPVRIGGRVQRPDYALFADEAAKSEAYDHKDDEASFYARALAVADAKYWERPLNETRRDDQRDIYKNTNPSFQIVNYLVGTGVDWGILTNGRLWRLYYRQASSTATEFYEVDLVDLLESGDLEQFKYFWLFFRRQAFIKDAQGRNFLERVREGSSTYARVIGDRLKEVVFERVFPLLSGGFAAYGAASGQDVTSEAARSAIYEATLSLLYKILFLLYAEARNLLPMDNQGYRSQSITRMAREVAGILDRAEPLGRTSTALYDRLLNLFRLIDRGDRGLGLPRYNGGLFHFDFSDPTDREKQRANYFLTQRKVPDAFLAPALDYLARADGEPIDYGFIGVRHLGAIYEGLLEYRLVVDEAASGRVHLETDKGERKATGSYYTPDYIVKYIVRHTVGPILEERAQRFDQLMTQIGKVRAQLKDGRHGPASIRTLRDKLNQLERQARETLLDIKICDPAMGSGHFLVEAVDFLTDGLIDILNRYPEHNPVLSMLDRIRGEIVASLQRQGIPIDPARLDDTQLLQRVVMKRCIYGVDLNPMAVELAKVSLWLHSFTVGAPLSFLDHHLRCGNSLIGAMAREVESEMSKLDAEGQLTFLTGPFAGLLQAAEMMRGISLLSDATFTEVEESERLFRQFDEAAKPYKQLLDVYVARHFGVKRADEFLRLYGVDAIKAGPETVGEPYATMLREVRRLYQEKRFFHWDLEFPEVFIDLEHATWKENPGFDAVVGNPPYGAKLDKLEKQFISQTCPMSTTTDTAEYFLECSDRLIRPAGSVSMIIPKSIAFYSSWQGLRSYIICERAITHLFDVGIAFEGVNYEQLVIAFRKVQSTGHSLCQIDCAEPLRRFTVSKSTKSLGTIRQDLMQREKILIFRPIDKLQEAAIRKVLNRSYKLDSLASDIFRGLYIPDAEKAALRPGRFTFVERVPDVARYEIHRTVAIDLLDRKKQQRAKLVMVPRLFFKVLRGKRLVVYPDILGILLTTEKLVNVVLKPDVQYNLLMITAVVNSPVPSFYLQKMVFSETTETSRVMDRDYVGRIPIPRIAFTTPVGERKRLVEEGIDLTLPRPSATPSLSAGGEGGGWGVGEVPYAAFLTSPLGRWLDQRLSPVHTPDPALIRQHNADPLNENWQLPEEGPVEQSDVVHDLLAHLAEQMMEMNKRKQAEVKGFLDWLEREMGASINDLTNKTRLRNYLGDYQKGESHLTLEGLLNILRKNRRRLGVDPTSRAFQKRLEQEYRASLDKLLPLKTRLAATDRLIDLIVYRLYGLTKDEVAVVEGHAP